MAAKKAEDDRRAATEALHETLARIPVPVASIPKLSGDVETIRSIETPETADQDRRSANA